MAVFPVKLLLAPALRKSVCPKMIKNVKNANNIAAARLYPSRAPGTRGLWMSLAFFLAS